MPRRVKKYIVSPRRPLKTIKYSNETFAFTAVMGPASKPSPGAPGIFSILTEPTNVGGMRKIKNISCRLSSYVTPVQDGSALWNGTPFNGTGMAALIYSPEGSPKPTGLNYGNATSGFLTIYEPNQNVISSTTFAYDNASGQFMGNRLARNLNSGDNVYLVVQPGTILPANATLTITVVVNYAICYN